MDVARIENLIEDAHLAVGEAIESLNLLNTPTDDEFHAVQRAVKFLWGILDSLNSAALEEDIMFLKGMEWEREHEQQ